MMMVEIRAEIRPRKLKEISVREDIKTPKMIGIRLT